MTYPQVPVAYGPAPWAVPPALPFDPPKASADMTLEELIAAYAASAQSARYLRDQLKHYANQTEKAEAIVTDVTTLLLSAIANEHGLINPHALSIETVNDLREDVVARTQRQEAQRTLRNRLLGPTTSGDVS